MLTLLALDLSPLAQPIISLLGLALTALCGIVGHAILSRTNSAKARDILERAGHFMYGEVAALAQTEVPTLTRVLSTGKLTAADAKALRDTAIARVKENLGPDGIKALNDATGDRSIDDYLLSLLESHVSELGKPLALATGTLSGPTADAPKPEPAPAGKSGFAMLPALIGAAVIVAALACIGAVSGCSAAQARHDAVAAIVTAGGATNALYQTNTRVYEQATSALFNGGVTGAAYDTAVAPINTAFRARVRAINTIDQCLYDSAAIVNASRSSGDVQLAAVGAASQALSCIRTGIAELQSGDVLPAISIPTAITTTLDLLAVIAGGGSATSTPVAADAGVQ